MNPHEFCGRIHKKIPLTPVIWDGEFVTSVEDQGDDFICGKHLIPLNWGDVASRPDFQEKAGMDYEAKWIEEGYTVYRDEHCTEVWDETNPCYAVGAMLFIDVDTS